MAVRDRLKALRLMERITRHQMEAIGAELSALRAEQAELETQKDRLKAVSIQEARTSTDDTRPYLPAYLQSVETQQSHWTEEQDKIEEKAVLAEARLMNAFREVKTREVVLGRVEQEVEQEKQRAEIAQMDDAGRALFVLGRNAQTAKP
ncbi:flagellar motor protein [Sulfitobacter sp. JBTF-M27]|uniref:Flagellar motor protein n=1 Tax=Sulfitobacter sediminilitoris TaxID=2698830 RepID=A0A6P0CDB0_9RHOB|nr:flagellar motor protein [Sulfitobacter sediminilitoris]NEK23857.1 flagellar motor protein [Sulfitobacter sediminilitoris]